MSDRPAPDPANLLEEWNKWEKGEMEPGRLLANLKKGGMKELLEEVVAESSESNA